jgi:hypothetical protein
MNKKCLFLFCIISIAGHTLYGLKTTEYRYGPGGKYGPQPRTPSVFVLDDFQEQRMWVDTKHGKPYICSQQLFSDKEWYKEPTITCIPAYRVNTNQSTILRNQPVCYFDGKQTVICPSSKPKAWHNVRVVCNSDVPQKNLIGSIQSEYRQKTMTCYVIKKDEL